MSKVLFRIGVHGNPTKEGYYECWYGKQKYGPAYNYWNGERWLGWKDERYGQCLFGLDQDYWTNLPEEWTEEDVLKAKERNYG